MAVVVIKPLIDREYYWPSWLVFTWSINVASAPSNSSAAVKRQHEGPATKLRRNEIGSRI